MDIGKRIKALRLQNGLTLEELASRCELTKGFLSQLERNLTSPSIATLQDITEVLGISLPDFFREEEEVPICFPKEEQFVDEKEKTSLTWLVPNSQNQMEPILLELREDGESQIVDPHKGEEFGMVLQGHVILEDLSSRKKYSLKKGDTFYLAGKFRHRLCNKAKGGSKVLWIATPPIF
ncbi:MAG: helix-turn-helix domain-containing protein [Erysipelotrichaceae bacterium]|nr:helix-turn-helix domain-containing protein [Erysipelotrichaceae bacterium]